MFTRSLRPSSLLLSTTTSTTSAAPTTIRTAAHRLFATMSHLHDSAQLAKSSSPPKKDHNTANLPQHEKHQVHRNRMERPPYSTTPDNADFKPIYPAECFCGNVQYEISREKPLDAKFCHCPTCQRLHGAPFQWAAIVHKTDVRFTRGKEDLIYWMPEEKSQEYVLPCKVSCRNCRSPIMDEGRNMLLLFPTLIKFGSLEEKRRFYPSCHIFYSRRAVDVIDGLPKFAKHKDESELIPERVDEDTEKQEAHHKS